MGRAFTVRPEDALAVCEMIARREVTQSAGAKLLSVSTTGMRRWLLRLGYTPERQGNGTRNKQWHKTGNDLTPPPPPLIETAPEAEDEEDLDTEGRLAQAAALLTEAGERLAHLAQVGHELAALRAEHADSLRIIEQQRKELETLRADAEFGREARKRAKKIQLRETTKMFDEKLLAVSMHLHPPRS